LARGSYFLLFLLVLTFFIVGFPVYLTSWNQGGIGVVITQDAAGKLITSVSPAGDAAEAGVRTGDYLISVNGITAQSTDQANQLLTGKIGDPVAITIVSGNQVPRQVSLVFAGRFMQLLEQMHLSLKFLIAYNITEYPARCRSHPGESARLFPSVR
jgi:predicted metalloprotease with PDZ domain